MKVGIITFHKAPNYGAMLQAYALQEILMTLGHSSFIIDYWPYDTYSLFRKGLLCRFNVKSILRELLLFKVKLARKRTFLAFADKMFRLISLDSHSENIDAFVIGSDQLWNSKIVKQPIYWGYYPAMRDKLLVTYAVSAGNDAVNDNLWGIQYLNLFSRISVREESLHKLLLRKGFDNTVVLDPTLLHMDSFYRKIQKAPLKCPNPFVLIYQIMLDEQSHEIAKVISGERNVEVIEIAADNRLRRGNNIVKSASPEEFLWYIDNAEVVITTSFHGTVFSIIYHKDFYVVDSNNKNDSRLTSLLSLAGLMNRRISSSFDIGRENIEWEKVDKNISLEREKSLTFLRDSLSVESAKGVDV